jgi:hypothetical protein
MGSNADTPRGNLNNKGIIDPHVHVHYIMGNSNSNSCAQQERLIEDVRVSYPRINLMERSDNIRTDVISTAEAIPNLDIPCDIKDLIIRHYGSGFHSIMVHDAYARVSYEIINTAIEPQPYVMAIRDRRT